VSCNNLETSSEKIKVISFGKFVDYEQTLFPLRDTAPAVEQSEGGVETSRARLTTLTVHHARVATQQTILALVRVVSSLDYL